MTNHPELDPIVARLHEKGVPATVESIRQHHMEMIGIRAAGEFFPLWELTSGGNLTDVAALNLGAIKARRQPGWTPFGFGTGEAG